jgi:predicted ATPase
MITINFKNLGVLKSGRIKLNDFVLIVGKNNTGKTYISYLLYSFFKFIKMNVTGMYFNDYFIQEHKLVNNIYDIEKIDLKEFVNKYFDKYLKKLSVNFTNNLFEFFNSPKNFFENTEITVDIDKDMFINIIKEMNVNFPVLSGDTHFILKKEEKSFVLNFMITEVLEKKDDKHYTNEKIMTRLSYVYGLFLDKFIKAIICPQRVFMLPAERAGMNLFYKELNVSRNAMPTVSSDETILNSPNWQIDGNNFTNSIKRYSVPVSDYIEFLNNMDVLKKGHADKEFKILANELYSILEGSFKIEENNIFFKPQNQGKQSDIHLSSSTAKNLFGFVFYLLYMAKQGDILMIDEPELNLHPNNQRFLAQLLAKLVNKKVKIVISTHSDYIIREINNLIILANDFKQKTNIMRKYNYTNEESLRKETISANYLHNNTIEEIEINPCEGIHVNTFDETIILSNEISDKLFFALDEEKEDTGDE